MKQFDLETYLQDPTRKVVTRDDREVRIICTDRKGDHPIIALVHNIQVTSYFEQNIETCVEYNEKGIYHSDNTTSHYDLFFADKEDELTEFEKCFVEEAENVHVDILSDDYTTAKESCKKLLNIARKEFEKEFQAELDFAYKVRDEVVYNEGYDKGHEDAIKDMQHSQCKSEDERIRKMLINVFTKADIDGGIYGEDITYKQVIAWLEKQGETFTKKDVDDAYLKGISDAKNELEKQDEVKESVISQHENKTCKENGNYLTSEDERIRKAIHIYLDWMDGWGWKDCAPRGEYSIRDMIDWLDKQGEQKPILDVEIPFGAKDSELVEASYYIPNGFHAEIDGDKVHIKKGEQKPDWSEEDEKLTEFEKEVKDLMSSCCNEIGEADITNELAKEAASNLLDLARKELQPEFEAELDKAYKTADNVQYQKGKQDALKDLPKWKKATENKEFDKHVLLFEDEDRVVLTTELYKDEYYIELDDLKILPKEE